MKRGVRALAALAGTLAGIAPLGPVAAQARGQSHQQLAPANVTDSSGSLPRQADAIADTSRHAPLALETFDAAWQLIYERHFDTTFNGVDWKAVRAELRPRAAAAHTTAELRAVIRDMLARLHESHFALIPREAADKMAPSSDGKSDSSIARTTGSGSAAPPGDATEHGATPSTAAGGKQDEHDGDVGVELRLVDGVMRVWKVAPGTPAAAAGVRPGWELRAVDRRAIASRTAAAKSALPAREAALRSTLLAQEELTGAPGSRVRLRFADARGRNHALALVRSRTPGTVVKFGNLPPLAVHLEHERRTTPNGPDVGIIRFNIWMPVILPQFDSAMDAMRDANGIVIDLRGNLGGLGALVMGTSGHFLAQRVSLGSMKMRTGELRFFANPRLVSTTGARVAPYGGPVAILVDGLTASTSEIFAGGMQSIGRAHIIGDTTAGAVLPALNQRLPNGDVLYHAIAEFITPNGIRLEGRGVIPDDVTPLTLRDLRAGRDAALEAALRWISEYHARQHDPAPTSTPAPATAPHQ